MKAARFVDKVCNRKLARVEIEQLRGEDVVRYADQSFDRRPHAIAPYCSATSASMAATCPESCVFRRDADGKHGGCFADSGFTRMAGKKMDVAAAGMSPFEVILEEVDLIDAAFPRGVPQDGARGGRDLRLHTFGDVQSPGAASKGLGIGFAVHGWGAEIARSQLVPLKARRVAA